MGDRVRGMLVRGGIALGVVSGAFAVQPAFAAADADLALVKSDNVDPVTNKTPLVYTLNVTNNGADTATLVEVVDTLPPSVDLYSAQGEDGTAACTDAEVMVPNPNPANPNPVETTEVTCTVPAIANGADYDFFIVVRPTKPTETPESPADFEADIVNTATVDALEVDPNPGNDTDTESTHVRRNYNLLATLAGNPDPVPVGGHLHYEVGIVNEGPDAVADAEVSLAIPPSTTFLSASAGCSEAGGDVTSNAPGPLVPTFSPTGAPLHFEVEVEPHEAGVITATATVSAPSDDDQEETSPGNNSNSEDTVVGGSGNPTKKVCAGNSATIVDGKGGGIIDGTPRRDVIVAGGGKDRIRGRGGNDVICAGKGNDFVKGGNGSDRVRGGGGKDNLKGGPGKDDCAGGKGKDKLKSC
jgi:uncharacterized repeat protein (TIGR01451 family)